MAKTEGKLTDRIRNNRLVLRYNNKNTYKAEAQDLLAALKREPQNIKAAFQAFKDDTSLYAKRFAGKRSYKNLFLGFVVLLLFMLSAALLCRLEEGGFDLFMSIAIPFFVITAFLIAFALFYNTNGIYVGMTSLLIFYGVAFQVMLTDKNASDSYDQVTELAVFAALGIAVGLIMTAFLYYGFSFADKRFLILAVLIASTLFYLLLLFIGVNVAGTKAWINLGGISIQVTEITKVLAVIGMSAAFTDKDRSYKLRLLNALIILGFNALFLALISEFGTLIVIAICFFALGLVFLPKHREFIAILLCGALLVSAFVLFSKACYDLCYPSEAETEQSQEEETTAAEDETAAEVLQETAAEEEPAENAPADSEKKESILTKGILGKLTYKFANIYYKIYLRIILVTDPESQDPYGNAYQTNCARKALWVTNWITTTSDFEQYVPVIESDYIFIYVLMKIGIIGAMAILFALLVMLTETVKAAAKSTVHSESAAAIGFITCIVVQSIITAASSIGMIPTVGLTFAFLSSGGSATIVNYAMTVFILFMMRSKNLTKNRQGKVTRREAAADDR